MEELLTGNCYIYPCKDLPGPLSIMILGNEPSPHDFIYHACISNRLGFDINFAPIHKDMFIGLECLAQGTPNKQFYDASLASYVKYMDEAKAPGYRTYFTVSIEDVFKYGMRMFKMAKDLGNEKNFLHETGQIILPGIWPT